VKGGERIFLIGARGSGKTTLARLLADRLGWCWIDADVELERRAGRSIREVFAEEGETGFRDREAELLAELCERPGQVVATGGGVILRPSNRDLLRQAGWVVWLAADVATLCQRLQQDGATAQRRPSLTGAAAAAPEEVAAVLRGREPLYRECADLIVQTPKRTPAELVAEIAAVWNRSDWSPAPSAG